MRKRQALILLALMIALLFVTVRALAIEETYKALVQEAELREQRALTDREKQRIYNLLEEAQRDRLERIKDETPPKEKNYYNNTVCSFGPQFRELSSNLTREWYMFTPIDLSREGEQTFDLIGGGMYVIGKVTVTVKDGAVTVDYAYASREIDAGREYFTFFADYESVTRQDMDNFQKRYAYGKAYDIEQEFNGDTSVLLFICNTATFEKTTGGVYRYYETNEDRVAMRDKMLEMIGK